MAHVRRLVLYKYDSYQAWMVTFANSKTRRLPVNDIRDAEVFLGQQMETWAVLRGLIS